MPALIVWLTSVTFVAIFRGYIADVDAVVVWMAALHVPFLAIGFSKYKPVAN